ncbi:DNA-directed RNA polymerase [Candidatus Woesearchaeota archaeon]|nr:DNA-directed RNA polymerase [Candidatus Woesearchaeota archaeon]
MGDFDRGDRRDSGRREGGFRGGGHRGGFGGGHGGGFRRGGGFGGPREMHKAVCTECGAECEVPFKPTEGKPVLCRDCFAKKREQRDRF